MLKTQSLKTPETSPHFFTHLWICLLVFSIGLTLYAPQSQAYDFYKYGQKKQVAKDAKRWSLSDWLEQKKNSKLSDMWLMFNAPSPYEFFLGVDTSSYSRKNTQGTLVDETQYRNYRASMGAFVSLIGLYGEYETSDEDLEQWKGLLMLRLLGSSDQSTNFTIHYGLLKRSWESPNLTDSWNHQLAGGRFSLYLLKSFALTGQYDYLIGAESETAKMEAEGYKIQAGAHLEYGAFRLYGFWYSEKLTMETPVSPTVSLTEGIQFGTRLYF